MPVDLDQLPTLDLGSATRQGEYLLLDSLGEGGLGKVWRARQHALQRDVAIKSARPGAAHDAGRFLVNEALVTGLLEHPNIVPVHALGLDEEGSPLIVQKQVSGVTWQTLIKEPTHPAWQQVEARIDADHAEAEGLERKQTPVPTSWRFVAWLDFGSRPCAPLGGYSMD